MPMNAESTSHAVTSAEAFEATPASRRDAGDDEAHRPDGTLDQVQRERVAGPHLAPDEQPDRAEQGVAAAASTPTVSVGMPAVVPETMATDAPSDDKTSAGAGTHGDAPTDARTRVERPRGPRERRARAWGGAVGRGGHARPRTAAAHAALMRLVTTTSPRR